MINGAKQFITNAGTDISGVVCITARTDDPTQPTPNHQEISNLIVANGTAGYEQAEPYRKMGWNASDTRPLTFTDCRVPEENLLGMRGTGFHAVPAGARHRADRGRRDGRRAGPGRAGPGAGLRQGAPCVWQADLEVPAIQAKLADLATEIAAARLLIYHAAWLKDFGPPQPFALAAAQAKLKTGRLAVKAADEAVQIHGGYGYIEEYPVCRFYRDAKILTIGEGTDEVQQMVIARALGA